MPAHQEFVFPLYGDLDYLDLDVIVLVVVRLGQHQLQGDEAGHVVGEGGRWERGRGVETVTESERG